MSVTQNLAPERVIDGVKAPAPGTWVIDPTHTTVEFVARHLLTKVRGRFDAFSGQIEVAGNPADSRVELVIDAASVNTNNEQRDGHLRSPDFFDAESFSELRFVSTRVEPVDGDTWKLIGDLTIRGVTKPVELTFEYLGVLTDPFGNVKANFSAFTEVNREEWGLTWNAALETGGVLVAKTVRLEFEIQAVRS